MTRDAVERIRAEMTARRVIERFDVDYDALDRRDEAVGLLMVLGTSKPPEPDAPLELLVDHLGFWWCRLVRSDVDYALLEGLHAIESSRALAELVEGQLDTAPTAVRAYGAYVLARWHDASARIAYRFGDFNDAVRKFERALEIAETFGVLRCRTDILSNRIRAVFEEAVAGGQTDAKSKDPAAPIFAAIRDLRLELWAARRQMEDPALSDPERREMQRGRCNLLHNLATLSEKAAHLKGQPGGRRASYLARSRAYANRALAAAASLGDRYRKEQADNHLMLLDLAEERWEEAGKRLQRMVDPEQTAWVRGRRMALQRLAEQLARRGEPGDAMREIGRLLDDCRNERMRAPMETGVDLSLQTYAMMAAEKALKELAERTSEPVVEISALRKRAKEERLAVARSVRQVVKSTKYKKTYTTFIRPTFLEEIGARLQDREERQKERLPTGQVDEAIVGLFEEVSARELLDMMGDRGPSAHKERVRPGTPHPTVSGVTKASQEARRAGLFSFALSRAQVEALKQQKLEVERAALEHPMATYRLSPEIAHELRMFCANHDDTLLLRYFTYGSKGEVSACAFWRGQIAFLGAPIAMEKVRAILAHMQSAAMVLAPSVEDATVIYNELLAPAFALLGGAVPRRLVIVPVGDLFAVPFHVAWDSKRGLPLGATTEVALSVSAAAHVARGRHWLARQFFQTTDDLVAIVDTDESVSGAELSGLEWPEDQLFVAGARPQGTPAHRALAGDDVPRLLEDIAAITPELVLFAGHGKLDSRLREDVGPVLSFRGSLISELEIASRLALPRNKLTILSACVSGLGAELGGEVAGLIRAFMAAGAGALAVSQWSVRDSAAVHTARALLTSARVGMTSGTPIDILATLRGTNEEACRGLSGPREQIEACPFALYL